MLHSIAKDWFIQVRFSPQVFFLNSNLVSVFFMPWWRASQSINVLYILMACFTKSHCSIYHDGVLHKTSAFYILRWCALQSVNVYIPSWCASQSVSVPYTMMACFTKRQLFSFCKSNSHSIHKSIQNPFKHLRWSFVQKTLTAKSVDKVLNTLLVLEFVTKPRYSMHFCWYK